MRLYRPHIFGNCTTLTEQLLSRKIGKKFLMGIQEIRRMNEEENKKKMKKNGKVLRSCSNIDTGMKM